MVAAGVEAEDGKKVTLTYRPCGACVSLVDVSGCEHWAVGRTPEPTLIDNRTGDIITAASLATVSVSEISLSTLLAFGRAPLQREMIGEAMADPRGDIPVSTDRSRRHAFAKMVRTGQMERITREGKDTYRITPLGRAVAEGFERARREGKILPSSITART
jgi:hypothetical protein